MSRLRQIALMYEKLGETEETSSYMEMTLAQEEGPRNDDDEDSQGQGTGVTTKTSKPGCGLRDGSSLEGGLQDQWSWLTNFFKME